MQSGYGHTEEIEESGYLERRSSAMERLESAGWGWGNEQLFLSKEQEVV